jgi:hypothetical protein
MISGVACQEEKKRTKEKNKRYGVFSQAIRGRV